MTSEDVVAVLDPVDRTLVTEVIATGATQADLAIVFAIDDVGQTCRPGRRMATLAEPVPMEAVWITSSTSVAHSWIANWPSIACRIQLARHMGEKSG
ncbi:hypothetical protein MOV61_04555 [Neorhizobium sp. BETTINA12A]|uniref:hypothetical protein n=1 Tax=Neorhizobium sp. BETTINA12A TaxID=2908924 RepID=UPI001FF1E628|nr:hypothetical protein [Neorhizobium sp. BETTINA12A]MCJ9749987.1 hypothetical protein [Neorhizobium sp. BETTINA12A]